MAIKPNQFDTTFKAQSEFLQFKDDPLFMAGLMLYASGGDKSSKYVIRFSNSDPLLCLTFRRFIDTFFPELQTKVRFWALCYPDAKIIPIEGYWMKLLHLSKDQMYKSQFVKAKTRKNRLPNGVGNVTIASRQGKVRLLEFLRLAIKVLSK